MKLPHGSVAEKGELGIRPLVLCATLAVCRLGHVCGCTRRGVTGVRTSRQCLGASHSHVVLLLFQADGSFHMQPTGDRPLSFERALALL